MNTVRLSGRLCKAIELRQVKGKEAMIPCAQFTLAVDKKFKDADGNRQADFIDCVAWRGTAEYLAKWTDKGARVIIGGSLSKRSYKNSNDITVYITEVVVDEVEVIDFKKPDQAPVPTPPESTLADTAPNKPLAPSIKDSSEFDDSMDGLPFEF